MDPGVGAIIAVADRSVVLSSRTYTVSGPGSMGQRLAVVELTPVSPSGTSATLIQLDENDRFRTNVGVMNLADEAAEVTLSASFGEWHLLGSVRVTLPPHSHRQLSDLLRSFGAGTVDAVYVRVTVPPQGRVIPYVSVVDNSTRDPTFIPARRMP